MLYLIIQEVYNLSSVLLSFLSRNKSFANMNITL